MFKSVNSRTLSDKEFFLLTAARYKEPASASLVSGQSLKSLLFSKILKLCFCNVLKEISIIKVVVLVLLFAFLQLLLTTLICFQFNLKHLKCHH